MKNLLIAFHGDLSRLRIGCHLGVIYELDLGGRHDKFAFAKGTS